MKEGDLVICQWGEIGIVLWQVGETDQYMVYWESGQQYALNGCEMEVISEGR